MPKRVVDVGNCVPDHAAIRSLVEQHFDAQVVGTQGWPDTFSELQKGAVDLVLVNRRLDRDGSDGLDIIQQIKDDPQLAETPCMLITNSTEHQASAVQAGAEQGFGKAELHETETVEKLRGILG
jgi:CheY-like chemotaxis protein